MEIKENPAMVDAFSKNACTDNGTDLFIKTDSTNMSNYPIASNQKIQVNFKFMEEVAGPYTINSAMGYFKYTGDGASVKVPGTMLTLSVTSIFTTQYYKKATKTKAQLNLH